MTEPRRSRTHWPGPLEIAGVGEGHDHRLNRRWKIMLGAWAALTVATAVAVGVLFWLLILSDEYAERERRAVVCALLDAAPADDPLLDDMRYRFDCGPGRPVDDYPPDVRQQLQPAPTPTRPSAPPPAAPRAVPPAPGPPMGGALPPAQPTQAAEPPVEPTPPPAPSPAPSEPPLIDLGPVTDLLCEGRIACA